MKKKISILLVMAMIFGMLPPQIIKAADNIPDTLAEIQVYAEDTNLNWLTMNGNVVNHEYTYYQIQDIDTGSFKEIPAYCVNPDVYGVGQVTNEGTSVTYNAIREENDDLLKYIVANGYPRMGLDEFGLSTKQEGYYATKTAIWLHIQSGWTTSGLGINPNLGSADKAIAEKILEAVEIIYRRGTEDFYNISPDLTVVSDQSQAYVVTIGGEEYYQQIFHVTSATWCVLDGTFLTMPADAPSGAKFLDLNDNEINFLTFSDGGRQGYEGDFKVVYPVASVEGLSGSFQINLDTEVVQYAIFYAISAEYDSYGNLQNYLVDSDPVIPISTAVSSYYTDEPNDDPKGNLRIVKLQSGTEIPLSGAIFEVLTPDGDTLGSFVTNTNGLIELDAPMLGNYTITELVPPQNHTLGTMTTQNVTVRDGETAELTFWNDPYGSLRVLKTSDTGDLLNGVTIQIKHIESGETHTGTTTLGGVIQFDKLPLGAYEVREIAGIEGYILDLETVKTVTVVSDETVSVSFVNKEKPGLKIIKYDRVTMERLPDVTFEIFRDGKSLGLYTTDYQGEIILVDQEEGVYTVYEVQSDYDHITDSTPRQVELIAGDGILELVFFNDEKPKMGLIKVDSQDLSVGIPFVTFEIKAVDGSFGPEEFVTDEDGRIDLSHLTEGAYVVTELLTADGYIIDNAQRIIELKANDTAEFVFTNTKKPSLELVKYDPDNKLYLDGAAFRISKVGDGTNYLDRITENGGKINVEGLDVGVYNVQEISAPDGYLLNDTIYQVELFAGKTSTLVVVNKKMPELQIIKTDILTGDPVGKVTFIVKRPDGETVATVTTDEDGQVTVVNLEEGVYEVTEISVPEGYILDSTPQMVTLVANKTAVVKFENYPKPSLEVTKKNVDGDIIQDAVFTFAHKDGPTIGDFTTGEDGKFLIENLDEGYYILTEKSVPHPYILDTTAHEVYLEAGKLNTVVIENKRHPNITIKKVDSITGSALDGAEFTVWYAVNGSLEGDLRKIGTYTTNSSGEIFLEAVDVGWYRIEETRAPSGYSTNTNNVQDVFLKADEDQTFTFKNTPLGALIIKKVDATNGEVLQGAKFRLRYFSGVSGTEGTVIGEYETDVTGTIIVTGLEKGTYMIQEFYAPNGYIIDDAPQTVYMTGEEQDVILIEFENQPDSGLFVVKVDAISNEPLMGATFKVETDDGTVVGNYDGIYTTDENGMFHIPNLPTDTYVVTELTAPNGYALDAIPQTVKLIHGETHRLTFANNPDSGLMIVKVDALTNELLEGATFKVETDDGTVVGNYDGLYTTDENGVIHIPDLPTDTYVVTELTAPTGYVRDAIPQTVKLISGETHRLTFANYPDSGLWIYKQDRDSKEPLEGAVFKITKDDGILVGNGNGFFTTDIDGLIHLPDLETATYVVVEVEAPEGYILDDTPQTIKLTSGETHHLYFDNEKIPESSLLITKIDALTREPLKGATFKVTNKNGLTVGTGNGEFTTDSVGTIILTGLPLDTYVITEVNAPEGYVLDGIPQTIELLNGEVHNLTFENFPDSGLWIHKIDKESKESLEGAVFKVTTDDGTVVGNANGYYTTDEYGFIHLPNLETDTYVIQETEPPSGYYLDPEPQTVKLISGETHSLTFSNEKIPEAGLLVTKIDEVTKETLSGAVFKITTSTGAVVGTDNGEFTTDENGSIYLPKLPIDTYIVTEITPPVGYLNNSIPQTIQLVNNEVHKLTFTNMKIPEGGLLIRKLDSESREPLEGVEFKVTKKTGDLIGNFVTDEDGQIYIPDLSPNWYTVYEMKAADGYILDGQPKDVEVLAEEDVTLEITNMKESAFMIQKVDSVTGEGIQGVTFLISNSFFEPIGQYSTDDSGYVLMDKNLTDGKYFIRELQAADGYILDDTVRTFHVLYGETTLIKWENTPQMGQLQITKTSADHNPMNGMPAGTLLPDAVFEIISKKGVVVDTIKTDNYGRAVSKMLPLGYYSIREIEAPMYYMTDITEIPVEIEFVGQIVKVEMINYSASTNVSIDKTGYSMVTPNQTICYDFDNIANNSTVALDSFYWRDTLPVDGAFLDKIVTGTYNQQISYKVVYKTNNNDYRTLADNLSTSRNNVLEASAVALGLASDEYVTEFMFVFGNVVSGFSQVEAPQVYCTTHSWLTNGFEFVNNCDVGGVHNGQWIMSNDRWVTKVIAPVTPPSLPQTGF